MLKFSQDSKSFLFPCNNFSWHYCITCFQFYGNSHRKTKHQCQLGPHVGHVTIIVYENALSYTLVIVVPISKRSLLQCSFWWWYVKIYFNSWDNIWIMLDKHCAARWLLKIIIFIPDFFFILKSHLQNKHSFRFNKLPK